MVQPLSVNLYEQIVPPQPPKITGKACVNTPGRKKYLYFLSPKIGRENKVFYLLFHMVGIKFYFLSPKMVMKIILVIFLVKKGYGLVSVRSQPYRTRPEAECDTAD